MVAVRILIDRRALSPFTFLPPPFPSPRPDPRESPRLARARVANPQRRPFETSKGGADLTCDSTPCSQVGGDGRAIYRVAGAE